MPRGNAPQTKVHYQGKDEDFVIYVDSVQAVRNWKDDRSIPLAHVVSGFKIFVTHKYVHYPRTSSSKTTDMLLLRIKTRSSECR